MANIPKIVSKNLTDVEWQQQFIFLYLNKSESLQMKKRRQLEI